MKHKMGFKLLKDSQNFYLCLLEATGKVVANDLKYRTSEVFIHQIIGLHNLKKVNSVNHINFYDSTIIKYIEKQHIVSNLDISADICGEGIHYFPMTGSTVENFLTYFRLQHLNIGNIYLILDSWFSNIGFVKKYN